MERNLCIHDEIVLEAPIESMDEVGLILQETMEEAGNAMLRLFRLRLRWLLRAVGQRSDAYF